MSLRGGPELRSRLKALKLAFKPVGRAWGDDAVRMIRAETPRRTGKTAASVRIRNNTQARTTIAASHVMSFIDKGTKAHDEVPRKAPSLVFQASGRTIFAKKVHKPRTQGRHIVAKNAKKALEANPAAKVLISEWNRAA